MTLHFDMLTDKEIFGYEREVHFLMDDPVGSPDGTTQKMEPLNIFKEYGSKVEVTDLALLLGGNDPKYSDPDIAVMNPITWCGYPRTVNNPFRGYARTEAKAVISDGRAATYGAWHKDISVRPAVFTNYYALDNRYSSAFQFFSDKDVLNLGKFPLKNGKCLPVSTVTSGEYPQMLADSQTSSELEKLYQAKELVTTGKTYTFDTTGAEDRDAKTRLETLQEYTYRGKKYIRVIARARRSAPKRKFCNGEEVKEGQAYWIEVQPIEWYRDFPTGILLAKKCLFAGLPLAPEKGQLGIHKYMETYFAKEASLSEWEKLSEYQEKLEKIVAKKKEDRETRKTMADKLKETRRKKTNFLDRLFGASGQKKAIKAAKKFHKKNPEQRTALNFGRSKKTVHE